MELYNEMHPEVNVDVRIDAGREQAKSGSVFARTAVLIAADDMGDLFLWAGYVFVYWAKRGSVCRPDALHEAVGPHD